MTKILDIIDQIFKINYQKILLSEIKIIEIEKQSEYRFFFEQSSINLQPKVSIQIQNASIVEVLEKLFAKTTYSYQIIDRHIILSQEKSTTAKPPVVSTFRSIRKLSHFT